MPLPLTTPDVIEVGEYLATHILLEIEAGQYSREDLQDSPEIGCLEQIAAPPVDGKVPPAIADVLARAKAAGRLMSAT